MSNVFAVTLCYCMHNPFLGRGTTRTFSYTLTRSERHRLHGQQAAPPTDRYLKRMEPTDVSCSVRNTAGRPANATDKNFTVSNLKHFIARNDKNIT